eukprot:CAMPEP_0117757266 /NCGR_PEP_ID=MMETSP0947-20121206/14621_1 /TAXON_ID=44440 /ORGANISM="Chattonella subsalsa, Strain CCMP2191" /LENGTH=739 /DNA_ID=CAMNT_0005577111 /DNA_START=101 /DNA_END=2320 /DNA_ORIENTATION=+
MEKLKDLNFDALRNAVEEVATTVKPKNDTEKRVYEALSNKNWGASSSLMQEIARDTFDFEKYPSITKLIWAALDAPGRSWRQVFKGLTLLEFLIKNGSERIIEDSRDHMHRIRMLQNFNYTDTTANIDRGQGVREKSKQVVDLLASNENIREEREKARRLRNKYVGVSNDSYSGGFGGNNSFGGSYDGFGSDPRGGGGKYSDSYNSGGGWSGGGGGSSYYGGDRPGKYSDRDSFDRDKDRSKGHYRDSGDSDVDNSRFTDKSENEVSSSNEKSSKSKKSSKKISVKINSTKKKEKSGDSKPKALCSKKSSAAGLAAPTPAVDLLMGMDDPAPQPAAATAQGQFEAFGDFSSAPPAGAPPAPPAQVQFEAFASFDPRSGVQDQPSPPQPQQQFQQPPPHAMQQPANPLLGLQASSPQMLSQQPVQQPLQPQPLQSQPLQAQPLQQQTQPASFQADFGQQQSIPLQQQMPLQPSTDMNQGFQQQMNNAIPPAQTSQPAQNEQFGSFQTNGDDNFGDFQGSSRPAAPAPEPSPHDMMSKLTDLGNLGKDKKEGKTDTGTDGGYKYNSDTSFQGLDGFSKTPQPMAMNNAPLGTLGGAGKPGGMTANPMGAGAALGMQANTMGMGMQQMPPPAGQPGYPQAMNPMGGQAMGMGAMPQPQMGGYQQQPLMAGAGYQQQPMGMGTMPAQPMMGGGIQQQPMGSTGYGQQPQMSNMGMQMPGQMQGGFPQQQQPNQQAGMYNMGMG